jgi:site-specific recombinase XerD
MRDWLKFSPRGAERVCTIRIAIIFSQALTNKKRSHIGQMLQWKTTSGPLRAGIEKRIGWHVLRHTFGTLVKSQGADVATIQATMRHANVSVTMDCYVQAITEAKREAHSRIVRAIPFPKQQLFLYVPTRLTGTAANA